MPYPTGGDVVDRNVPRRRSAASCGWLLLWAVVLVLSPLRPATAAADTNGTGGVPIATSVIYPVGAPTIQPTWDHANASGYYITQGFNTSCDPSAGQGYYLYGLYYCGHTGVDLGTTTASPVIHATAAGLVVSAGYNGSYGVMVRLRHDLPDGSVMYSQYEHLQYGSLDVYVGEIVSQGQELGLVGATGNATGPHLHFEIKSVDENGPGYTFGNASLIAGYVDGLAFVAAHLLQRAAYIASTGHPSPEVFDESSESGPVLERFLRSYQHFVVVAVSDGLHVRVEPGVQARIVGAALRGAKLGYMATKGSWIEVALPQHVQGWVDRRYVAGYRDWATSGNGTANSSWPPAGAVVATVAVLGLNVRSGPGEDHPIVTAAYHGDTVELLAYTPHWAQDRTRDGAIGWAARQYLQEPGAPTPHGAVTIVPTVSLLRVRTGPGLQYPACGAVLTAPISR